MSKLFSKGWLLIAVAVSYLAFIFMSGYKNENKLTEDQFAVGRIVVDAPILAMLFFGDRYLAANIEVMRLAATATDVHGVDLNYLIRAQNEAARLNPCHEDNYYLANGLLTWGGADQEGSAVLEKASKCRTWDELPPFLYGFNKSFFEHDTEAASHYLELAAQRATDNAAGYRKIAIMLKAEQIKDEALAIKYLEAEQQKVTDPKLKEMLAKRTQRLQGLAILRDAQRSYEANTGHQLESPEQLIQAGLIKEFPQDPLKLGYEFADGRFKLKKLKIAGMEEQP